MKTVFRNGWIQGFEPCVTRGLALFHFPILFSLGRFHSPAGSPHVLAFDSYRFTRALKLGNPREKKANSPTHNCSRSPKDAPPWFSSGRVALYPPMAAARGMESSDYADPSLITTPEDGAGSVPSECLFTSRIFSVTRQKHLKPLYPYYHLLIWFTQ